MTLQIEQCHLDLAVSDYSAQILSSLSLQFLFQQFFKKFELMIAFRDI